MTKRQNTNTKAFKTKVQSDLIGFFDAGKDGLIGDFNALKYIKNDYQRALHMVEGGCFDCYYNHVADTMAKWFDCSTDEIWSYYKDDEDKLWKSYCRIVVKNILCIVTNKRCYIN